MSNRALPKKEVKCAWSECNETVIIKIGAKYQPKYHSHSCAMKDLKGKAKPRKNTKKDNIGQPKEIESIKDEEVVSLIEMMYIPGYTEKFVSLCNGILWGEVLFVRCL